MVTICKMYHFRAPVTQKPTTQRPATPKVNVEDGYDYPKPAVKFEEATYLPPVEVKTTQKPKPVTTRATQKPTTR